MVKSVICDTTYIKKHNAKVGSLDPPSEEESILG
jgi:hypothetical protein